MPLSSGLLSSSFSRSAGSLHGMWLQRKHHSQGDPAVALAQGNSQDSAALPAPASSAALFPRVLTSSLLPAQGGVGLVEHHSQGDAALALAQGNSQDSAALPAPAPSAALYPRVLTSSLLPAQGGVGLVEVPTQIQALQAKVVSRLLEPETLAWKVFQLHHLSHAPQASQLAYGATILFSTASTASLQLPARLLGPHKGGTFASCFENTAPTGLDSLPPVHVVGTAPTLAGCCHSDPDSPGLASRPFSVRHSADPKHSYWYLCFCPGACHSLGSFQTLEGSNTAASPVHSRLVLTGAPIRPRPLVTWGVGLEAAARSSASGAAGQPALAADSGPEA
ncbi:hypothetical protein ABBQ38_012988 [Trebouxia sp. C0009 RCD-2024]